MPYWGDIKETVLGKTTVELIRLLKHQQLIGSNIFSEIWFRSEELGQTCSCTTGLGLVGNGGVTHAETCLSCYTTKKIGGYYKYGYDNFSIASIDPTLVFTDTEIFTDILPSRIVLKSGKITGTIITDRYDILNYLTSSIEYSVNSYIRDINNSSIKVEYSLDDLNYKNINLLPTDGIKVGKIRFKITLSRVSTSIVSPWFEILRFRYATMDRPYIRLVKNMPTTKEDLKLYGREAIEGGMRFSMAEEPKVTQRTLLQLLNGEFMGRRYFISTIQPSEVFAGRISQRFSVRKIQNNEIYSRIF